MDNKALLFSFYIILLSSCSGCKDEENLTKNTYWRNRICGNKLIYDVGVGYPVYKNTVVFHTTPEPLAEIQEGVLLGLDTKSGKEKWRLTNADFTPKKDLRFCNTFGTYQKENILVASDVVYLPNRPKGENYIFGIDIEFGKVLWVTQFPSGYHQIGNTIKGNGNFAYVNASNYNQSALFQVNVYTGEINILLEITNNDLPPEISVFNPLNDGFYLTDIYENSKGESFIALSLMPYLPDKLNSMSVLYVYNLTQNKKVYTTTVTMEGSNFWIYELNGRLVMGSHKTAFCYDAFENRKLWEKSVVLNDGVGFGSGNDEILQVLAYDNLALIFCVDRLVAFDINSGDLKYNVPSSHALAMVVDGVIYNEDSDDLVMRDVYTGKILKRISTGINEEGFARVRPNVVDGKVFIHSYTDAFCIKAIKNEKSK